MLYIHTEECTQICIRPVIIPVTAKHLSISLWFLMEVELVVSTGTHAYKAQQWASK